MIKKETRKKQNKMTDLKKETHMCDLLFGHRADDEAAWFDGIHHVIPRVHGTMTIHEGSRHYHNVI